MKKLAVAFIALTCVSSVFARPCTYILTDNSPNRYIYASFSSNNALNECGVALKKCEAHQKNYNLETTATCNYYPTDNQYETTINGRRVVIPNEGGIRIYFGD